MKDEPENLRDRTKRLALSVIRLYTTLPARVEAQIIGRQLLRSGTSPGAQYREAYRARSDAEFVSKMESATQELDETAYWLELLVDSGLMAYPSVQTVMAETDELIRIFVSCVKRAKS